jgi:tetratricopeptide (TPR) repeat protein
LYRNPFRRKAERVPYFTLKTVCTTSGLKSILLQIFIVKITATLFLLFFHVATHAQEVLAAANKCYEDKNYQCAADNYKKAIEEKKYQPKDHATILFRIGYASGELKKYEEAIRYFNESIVVNPGFADAFWSMAGNYYAMGKYVEATENYTKAIALMKDDKTSLKKLYFWRGKSYSILEKYTDALNNFQLALAIDSNTVDYVTNAAYVTYMLEKYSDAAGYYQRAINLGDKDKTVMSDRYYWLGQSHMKLKKYEPSVNAFKGAIEYNPDNKNAIWGLAGAYYNQSKWPDAISYYTKTMNFYKDDTASMKDLYYFRGRSYNSNKDHAKALADFDAILKIDPADRSAIWQKASVFLQQKKYKEALPFYAKTISFYKDEKNSLDDLHYFRGFCYLQLKDSANARLDFQQSLTYNYNLLDPNIQMGHLSYAAGKYYEAKDYYTKGVTGFKADSVEFSKIYFRRGFSNLFTGSGYTGKDDLLTSLRYDSSNKEAHRYLGEVYYTGSYFNLALTEFDKSISLYKNVKDSLPKMYYYRALCYSQLKKYKEALSDYEQADKLKPNASEYITPMGQLAFEIKAYQKTITNFTKAIALYKPVQKNELAFAYYARGRAYYELKDKVKAKKDIEKAIELVPAYDEAKKWLDTINKSN